MKRLKQHQAGNHLASMWLACGSHTQVPPPPNLLKCFVQTQKINDRQRLCVRCLVQPGWFLVSLRWLQETLTLKAVQSTGEFRMKRQQLEGRYESGDGGVLDSKQKVR